MVRADYADRRRFTKILEGTMRRTSVLIVTMASGIIMLITSLLPGKLPQTIYTTLLNWVMLIAAFAGIITIINLMRQHWTKVTNIQSQDIKSAYVLFAFIITLGLGIYLKPDHAVFQKIVTNIQYPIEGTLLGILGIVLIVAAIKLYPNKPGWMSLVFLLSTIVFLVVGSGILSVDSKSAFWKDALAAINTLPVAGSRGILIGVAIGAVITGVRVIFSLDKNLDG